MTIVEAGFISMQYTDSLWPVREDAGDTHTDTHRLGHDLWTRGVHDSSSAAAILHFLSDLAELVFKRRDKCPDQSILHG